MIRSLVIMFVQVFSVVSFSSTTEIKNRIESRVKEFFQSRFYSTDSLKQLDRHKSLHMKFKILKKSCEIEIKLNELPVNCYKWLDQLSVFGLVEQGEWRMLHNQFQRHCIQTSEKLDEPKILQGQKQIQEPNCNDALSNRLRKLQYMKDRFNFDFSSDELLE